jgi:hypothetical protein
MMITAGITIRGQRGMTIGRLEPGLREPGTLNVTDLPFDRRCHRAGGCLAVQLPASGGARDQVNP